MEQSWNGFWATVSQALHQALSPFRAVAEAFGRHPADAQIWCFLCGVLVLAFVAMQTYRDYLLRRRGTLTTGEVVDIDKSGEYFSNPIIEFTDRSGRAWRFKSRLPVNRVTGSIGAVVNVMYDPLYPKRWREVGRPLANAVDMTAGYAIVVGLMALAFWLGLRSV
jgi:hypothetical protein